MRGIDWSDSLSVGCDEVDAEHQALVRLINECIALSQAGGEDDRIVAAVARLIVFADRHFTNEEQVMEQAGYPDLERHSAAHKEAMQDLCRIGLKTGGVELCRSVGEYLASWFFAHAMTHDRELGRWLSLSSLACLWPESTGQHDARQP